MTHVLIHTADSDDHLVLGLFETDRSAEDVAVVYREYLRLRELAFERSYKEGDEYPAFADWCTRAAFPIKEIEFTDVDMFSGEVQ